VGWPGPHTAAGAFIWRTCVIGNFAFPPDATEGAVTVKVKSSQKIDQKQASGKNKAKSTQKGRPPCPVIVDMEFTARSWELVEEALTAIDPNGPSAGGPFSFTHPDANRRGVQYIMIDEVGEVDWKGHKGSVHITATEWEDPTKVHVGGRGGVPAGNAKRAQLDGLLAELDQLDQTIEQMIAHPSSDPDWRKNFEATQAQREKIDQMARDVQKSLTSTSETAKSAKDSGMNPLGGSGSQPQSGSLKSITEKSDPYTRTGAPSADP
jgi:hypothetical protein